MPPPRCYGATSRERFRPTGTGRRPLQGIQRGVAWRCRSDRPLVSFLHGRPLLFLFGMGSARPPAGSVMATRALGEVTRDAARATFGSSMCARHVRDQTRAGWAPCLKELAILGLPFAFT